MPQDSKFQNFKKIKIFKKLKKLYIMNLIFFLKLDSLRFPI